MDNTLRKAAEMALEYLEYLNELEIAGLDHEVHTTALRQALAQSEHNHLSDGMRLYQAVDRLATQAGEDASETIDWLCGEHGGMSKLFEAYFSPKPTKPDVTLTDEGKTEQGCAECGKKESDGWALYCVDCLLPAKREWVGLTDEEIMDVWPRDTRLEFVRIIEAKLKEKNKW